MTDNGVVGNFAIHDDKPTGTCAVLVYGKERTLCTKLESACAYPLSHLESNMA